MFSLTTTTTLLHRTPLPPSPLPTILSLLHNHDLLLHLDPELHSYIPLPPDPSLPPGTKRYKVTDHMKALPKGLWDSTVTFEAQMRDVEDGVEWVIKAPLGLVQRVGWRVRKREGEREGEEGGKEGEEGKGEEEGWELVEEVEIRGSRLLVGTVRGKCEENWRGVHGRFVERLESALEEARKGEESV